MISLPNFEKAFDYDNNFYLSGMISIDLWRVNTYFQTKFDQNKEFGFAGGVGLIW